MKKGPTPFAIRVGILLAVLAAFAVKLLLVRRAEARVPDWVETERVAVVILTPPHLDDAARDHVERLCRFAQVGDSSSTLIALEHWFELEHARYAAPRPGWKPVRFITQGPFEVETTPPPPPRAGAQLGTVDRYEATRSFLGWYEARLAEHAPAALNVMFVTFYGEAEAAAYRGVHSVSDRRSRRGFVFAPLSGAGRDLAVINVGHELLHLFGATDKYEGETCVYPQGWVEPFAEPRYPQRFAEVMAQGIPQEQGMKEGSLDLFESMRVGVETAREIGWIDGARRDRYYARDPAAAPGVDYPAR
jgi:hypothetical protein